MIDQILVMLQRIYYYGAKSWNGDSTLKDFNKELQSLIKIYLNVNRYRFNIPKDLKRNGFLKEI
ncbi:hypothetical protein AYJ02_20235 [Shewanella algae]|nr:hypothetical protein AYJ02_20235 [Shewanella algae]